MNLRHPRVWLGLLSLFGVLYLVSADLDRTSPGPLAVVHERDPELASEDGCALCHGGRGVSLADACLECHSDIEGHIDGGRGLHGTLDAADVRECAHCHGDHHGTDFAIINPRSFLLAGVRGGAQAFEHDLVGFAMAGAHLELACTECHEHAEDKILPEGARRFIGLAQDCATCHEDPHEGALVQSCVECHVQEAFDDHRYRDHDEHFPLTGQHTDLSCRDCHGVEHSHALEAVVQRTFSLDKRGCADCHDSPHADAFVGGVAALVTSATDAGCATCHVPEDPTFHELAHELSDEQHAASGFELTAPHAELACAECHSPELATFAERYPGREADSCIACHGDPHEGQFEHAPFLERGCLSCHDRHQFAPHNFDLAMHAETRLELTGKHEDVACEECHGQPRASAARAFAGTPASCERCHDDAHRGFFDALTLREAHPDGTCASCHGTHGFDQVAADLFEHARATGFALEGAHDQAACEACHAPRDERDELGRLFGWAHQQFGTIENCGTCHDDVHGGRFDAAELPQTVEGRDSCGRCHQESSFRTLHGGFDHGLWTGYNLDGSHADLGCADCHAPLGRPDEHGRTWAAAAGNGCADCHGFPHAGQFVVDGQVDCARCHGSTDTFTELSFNHDRDTRFELGDAHDRLECAACHKAYTLDGGVEVVRYRPLGRDCKDCHGDQRGPVPGGKRERR